jgi:Peptidase A4 family
VPAIVGACSSQTQYASFWVGIDGYSTGTVEQIGTDSDCSNGSPSYYAWYEFYPKYPYIIPIQIKVGDIISAEVSYSGGGIHRFHHGYEPAYQHAPIVEHL